MQILFILSVRADDFSIIWGTSQGEISIGGTDINTPVGQQEAPIGAPEVPVTPPVPGAGGVETTISGFGVNNTFMLIKIKKGEPIQQRILITNRGNTSLSLEVSVENLEKFIFPGEKNFILNPGESKSVLFNIFVSETEKENIFTGRIKFRSATSTINVDVVMEATEKAPLFDIKTTLLKKILFQGQKATADIRVLNLGDLRNIDVELESKIIDSQNKVYDSTKESFAINTSATKKVSLQIPHDMPLGKYYFSTRVSYKNISATSYDAFNILEAVIQFGALVFYLVTAIMIVLIALISVIIVNRTRRI